VRSRARRISGHTLTTALHIVAVVAFAIAALGMMGI